MENREDKKKSHLMSGKRRRGREAKVLGHFKKDGLPTVGKEKTRNLPSKKNLLQKRFQRPGMKGKEEVQERVSLEEGESIGELPTKGEK